MSRRFENFGERLEGRAASASEGDAPAASDAPDNPETPDESVPDPDQTPDQEDEEMSEETPLEEREDYQAGFAAGRSEASARMNAVFASEHVTGREAHAVRLLGREMSSDDIIAELPNYPAASTLSEDEQREAAEEGGRKEMRDAMNEAETKDLGADKSTDKDRKSGRAKADSRWDKANAHVGRTKKEG